MSKNTKFRSVITTVIEHSLKVDGNIKLSMQKQWGDVHEPLSWEKIVF